MRHTGMYVVELGVGIGKGGKNIRLESVFHLGGGEL